MSVQRTFPVIPEVSRSVQDEFRQLRKLIYDAQDQLQAGVQVQNLNQPSAPIQASSSSSSSSSTAAPASVIINNAITSPTGGFPNVTQLIGVLAQAQRSFIPEYTTLPVLQDPASQNGSLVSINQVLYRFDGDSQPGEWKPQGAVAVCLIGTMAQRLASFPPTDFPPGTLFYETDTEVLYVDYNNAWVNILGTVLLEGTHSNRLASTPSVTYALSTTYYETDRTVRYWVQNATGHVTVTGGTTVTWVSGNHFINTGSGFTAAQWPAGTPIVIDGVMCHVASVSSPTVLTLQAATTNAANKVYSVASGRWVYLDGEYIDIGTNIPTDLGENDYGAVTTTGFLFFDSTHWRMFQWQPQGGQPAAATPGWTRGPGEVPTGKIDILPFGPGTSAGLTTGWSLCNGGTVTITQDDASTTSVTKPNMIGAYPKGGTTGSYSPTQNPASVTGNTDDTMIGFVPAGGAAGATATPVTVQSGTGATVNSLTSGGGGGGGGSLINDPHHHSLSTVAVDVANVVVPFYMKR